jgi:hypothetical protein
MSSRPFSNGTGFSCVVEVTGSKLLCVSFENSSEFAFATTMTKGGKKESDITWHGTTAGAASEQRSVQICHLGEARGNQLGHGWPDFFLRMFDPS